MALSRAASCGHNGAIGLAICDSEAALELSASLPVAFVLSKAVEDVLLGHGRFIPQAIRQSQNTGEILLNKYVFRPYSHHSKLPGENAQTPFRPPVRTETNSHPNALISLDRRQNRAPAPLAPANPAPRA